jgi:hypothetical protein
MTPRSSLPRSWTVSPRLRSSVHVALRSCGALNTYPLIPRTYVLYPEDQIEIRAAVVQRAGRAVPPSRPIEQYLTYLDAIGRVANTQRAYAQGLARFFAFLRQRGLEWQDIGLDEGR